MWLLSNIAIICLIKGLCYLFHIAFCIRYVMLLVLDKVVNPFLLKYSGLDMEIWHPTSGCEKTMDALLKAQVNW